MVGIDGMAEPQGVGEKRRPQKHRIIVEGCQRPRPGKRIGEQAAAGKCR